MASRQRDEPFQRPERFSWDEADEIIVTSDPHDPELLKRRYEQERRLAELPGGEHDEQPDDEPS